MKEYSSQDGGRYTFVDDLINLQNLALAFTSIFNDCGNFVVWGCELNGNKVSEGFVFINGKLRQFSGGSCSANAAGKRFLYEHNQYEAVPYASGNSKVGRTNYSVALGNFVPSSNDTVTLSAPQYIEIKSDGSCRRLKDAFFGRLSLLLENSSQQTITGPVVFGDTIQSVSKILSNGPIEMSSGNGLTKLYFNNGEFVIQAKVGANTFRIVFNQASGIEFYFNSKKALTVAGTEVVFHLPINSTSSVVGSVCVLGDHIFNANADSDDGVLNINMRSSNGETSAYRSTVIGDGKGTVLLDINGKYKCITSRASIFEFNSPEKDAVVLKGNLAKNNTGYIKNLVWKDVADEKIASVGFNSTTDNIFEIRNIVSDIRITGSGAVDIGPAIKENGQLLSSKYMTQESFAEEQQKKADASDVYTAKQTDQLFAKLSDGFSSFAGVVGKPTLRSQIDAVSPDDLSEYVMINKYLSDMADTEEAKKKIRANIGAASADEVAPKTTDTGWKPIGSTGLYIRQIGDIVNIQGTVTPVHTNNLFTIPNGIESPAHTIGYCWSNNANETWACKIDGGKRECVVTTNTTFTSKVPFSLTYFV